MERIALHTSPKGIANLQIFNAPQNFLSKKVRGYKKGIFHDNQALISLL